MDSVIVTSFRRDDHLHLLDRGGCMRFIQCLIETGTEDGDIRIVIMHVPDTFRSSNQTNVLDVLDISFFQETDSCYDRSAGCQHRVKQNYVTFVNIARQLAIILYGVKRFRITVLNRYGRFLPWESDWSSRPPFLDLHEGSEQAPISYRQSFSLVFFSRGSLPSHP